VSPVAVAEGGIQNQHLICLPLKFFLDRYVLAGCVLGQGALIGSSQGERLAQMIALAVNCGLVMLSEIGPLLCLQDAWGVVAICICRAEVAAASLA